MIVCVCRRVSERDIALAVQSGHVSIEALQQTLGVASGCGRCRDCAVQTLQSLLQSSSASAHAQGPSAARHGSRVIPVWPVGPGASAASGTGD